MISYEPALSVCRTEPETAARMLCELSGALESLRRLQTETIDLVEFHEVVRQEDADMIFAAGGGMEALVEARQAGKIRYIGFSGHKSPAAHLGMLQMAQRHSFAFDAVQMPLNVMDAHFRSFQNEVVPVLQQHDTGVLGMKTLGENRILRSGRVSARESLRYSMSLPLHVAIVGCDATAYLREALEVASSFCPLSAEEREEMLCRTAAVGRTGECEPYKTTTDFDATLRNPHWLGLGA